MNNKSMRKEQRFKPARRFSVIVSVLFIIAITMFIVPNKNLIPTASGTTLYVGGSGFGNHSTIQEAVNAAIPGDTIFVYDDSAPYLENVVVNKTLSLVGENKDTTIVDGDFSGDVIYVTANWVNITGFTVKMSGWNRAGIHLYNVQNCSIFGNNALNNWYGIYFDSTKNNKITGNNISDSWSGSIRLHASSGIDIASNTMVFGGIIIIGNLDEHWNTHNINISNTLNGKPVYYWKNRTLGTIPTGVGQVILANCSNIMVENQKITNCTACIELGFSLNCDIIGNTASNGEEFCVYLYSSVGNNLIDNNFSSSGHGIYLNVSSKNNITNNVLSSCGYGIYLRSSSNNLIKDNNFKSTGHGVYLHSSSNNNITGNNLPNKGSYSIYIGSSSRNSITNNNVSLSTYGIDLSGSSNNKIIGNNVSSSDIFGIRLQSSNDNIIKNNNFSNNHVGVGLSSSSDNSLIHNTVLLNNEGGMRLQHSNNNVIKNNNVSSNKCNGINFYFSSNYNIITGNIISSNNGDGMNLSSSLNNIIANNYVLINSGHGIYLESLSSNIVNNNIVTMNNLCGIRFESSNDNNITNNVISNNRDGIYVLSSSNNSIRGNHISDHLEGLNISSSSNNNIISGNNVSNNWAGISLFSSLNNSIHHNNIINNTNQAYDDRNDNYWDNGYPSGGNYWSDFDEPSEDAYDDYQGPNQLSSGSDGIVDNGTILGGGKNPYVIDSDSQDNYPLIEPCENYIILNQGWNLISIPLIQVEQNLTRVLERIDGYYDAVQRYDIIDTNDHWKHYRVDKPFGNDLFEINETMGFWIHVTQPGETIFFYNGIRPIGAQNITLYPGWNLVGYPSLTNENRTKALNNIKFGADIDSIWTYNATTKKWDEIGEWDCFEIGRGYWIHSLNQKIWQIPL